MEESMTFDDPESVAVVDEHVLVIPANKGVLERKRFNRNEWRVSVTLVRTTPPLPHGTMAIQMDAEGSQPYIMRRKLHGQWYALMCTGVLDGWVRTPTVTDQQVRETCKPVIAGEW